MTAACRLAAVLMVLCVADGFDTEDELRMEVSGSCGKHDSCGDCTTDAHCFWCSGADLCADDSVQSTRAISFLVDSCTDIVRECPIVQPTASPSPSVSKSGYNPYADQMPSTDCPVPCGPQGTCKMKRSSLGAYVGYYCECNPYFYGASCDERDSCLSWRECGRCVFEDGCGWCEENQRCSRADESDGDRGPQLGSCPTWTYTPTKTSCKRPTNVTVPDPQPPLPGPTGQFNYTTNSTTTVVTETTTTTTNIVDDAGEPYTWPTPTMTPTKTPIPTPTPPHNQTKPEESESTCQEPECEASDVLGLEYDDESVSTSTPYAGTVPASGNSSRRSRAVGGLQAPYRGRNITHLLNKTNHTGVGGDHRSIVNKTTATADSMMVDLKRAKATVAASSAALAHAEVDVASAESMLSTAQSELTEAAHAVVAAEDAVGVANLTLERAVAALAALDAATDPAAYAAAQEAADAAVSALAEAKVVLEDAYVDLDAVSASVDAAEVRLTAALSNQRAAKATLALDEQAVQSLIDGLRSDPSFYGDTPEFAAEVLSAAVEAGQDKGPNYNKFTTSSQSKTTTTTTTPMDQPPPPPVVPDKECESVSMPTKRCPHGRVKPSPEPLPPFRDSSRHDSLGHWARGGVGEDMPGYQDYSRSSRAALIEPGEDSETEGVDRREEIPEDMWILQSVPTPTPTPAPTPTPTPTLAMMDPRTLAGVEPGEVPALDVEGEAKGLGEDGGCDEEKEGYAEYYISGLGPIPKPAADQLGVTAALVMSEYNERSFGSLESKALAHATVAALRSGHLHSMLEDVWVGAPEMDEGGHAVVAVSVLITEDETDQAVNALRASNLAREMASAELRTGGALTYAVPPHVIGITMVLRPRERAPPGTDAMQSRILPDAVPIMAAPAAAATPPPTPAPTPIVVPPPPTPEHLARVAEYEAQYTSELHEALLHKTKKELDAAVERDERGARALIKARAFDEATMNKLRHQLRTKGHSHKLNRAELDLPHLFEDVKGMTFVPRAGSPDVLLREEAATSFNQFGSAVRQEYSPPPNKADGGAMLRGVREGQSNGAALLAGAGDVADTLLGIPGGPAAADAGDVSAEGDDGLVTLPPAATAVDTERDGELVTGVDGSGDCVDVPVGRSAPLTQDEHMVIYPTLSAMEAEEYKQSEETEKRLALTGTKMSPVEPEAKKAPPVSPSTELGCDDQDEDAEVALRHNAANPFDQSNARTAPVPTAPEEEAELWRTYQEGLQDGSIASAAGAGSFSPILPDCMYHGTCAACARDGMCSWCPETTSCMTNAMAANECGSVLKITAAGREVVTGGAQISNASACDACAAAVHPAEASGEGDASALCAVCGSLAGCGWCGSAHVCVAGSTHGPSDGGCDGWQFQGLCDGRVKLNKVPRPRRFPGDEASGYVGTMPDGAPNDGGMPAPDAAAIMADGAMRPHDYLPPPPYIDDSIDPNAPPDDDLPEDEDEVDYDDSMRNMTVDAAERLKRIRRARHGVNAPVAVITAPPRLGLCAGLMLDGQSSTSPFLPMRYEYSVVRSGDDSVSEAEDAIQLALSTETAKRFGRAFLPRNLMAAAAGNDVSGAMDSLPSLSVSMVAVGSDGERSEGVFHETQLMPVDTPSVALYGTHKLEIPVDEAVVLHSSVLPPLCGDPAQLQPLAYRWSVSPFVAISDRLMRRPHLTIPPGTLTAEVHYNFTLKTYATEDDALEGSAVPGQAKVEVFAHAVWTDLSPHDMTLGMPAVGDGGRVPYLISEGQNIRLDAGDIIDTILRGGFAHPRRPASPSPSPSPPEEGPDWDRIRQQMLKSKAVVAGAHGTRLVDLQHEAASAVVEDDPAADPIRRPKQYALPYAVAMEPPADAAPTMSNPWLAPDPWAQRKAEVASIPPANKEQAPEQPTPVQPAAAKPGEAEEDDDKLHPLHKHSAAALTAAADARLPKMDLNAAQGIPLVVEPAPAPAIPLVVEPAPAPAIPLAELLEVDAGAGGAYAQDEDVTDEGYGYTLTWKCRAGCDEVVLDDGGVAEDKPCLVDDGSRLLLPQNVNPLVVSGDMLPDGEYFFTATATSDGVSVERTLCLPVIHDPSVHVVVQSDFGGVVHPMREVGNHLRVEVTSAYADQLPPSGLSYQWRLQEVVHDRQRRQGVTLSDVVIPPTDGPVLQLNPMGLLQKATYLFAVEAMDERGRWARTAKLTLAPDGRNGTLVASPLNGTSMETVFTFTARGFQPSTPMFNPVMYSFYLVHPTTHRRLPLRVDTPNATLSEKLPRLVKTSGVWLSLMVEVHAVNHVGRVTKGYTVVKLARGTSRKVITPTGAGFASPVAVGDVSRSITAAWLVSSSYTLADSQLVTLANNVKAHEMLAKRLSAMLKLRGMGAMEADQALVMLPGIFPVAEFLSPTSAFDVVDTANLCVAAAAVVDEPVASGAVYVLERVAEYAVHGYEAAAAEKEEAEGVVSLLQARAQARTTALADRDHADDVPSGIAAAGAAGVAAVQAAAADTAASEEATIDPFSDPLLGAGGSGLDMAARGRRLRQYEAESPWSTGAAAAGGPADRARQSPLLEGEMQLIESELRAEGQTKQMLLERTYTAVAGVAKRLAMSLETPRTVHLDAGRIQVFGKRLPLVDQLTDDQRTLTAAGSPFRLQLPARSFKGHGMLPSMADLQGAGVTAVAAVVVATLWDPFSTDPNGAPVPGAASPSVHVTLVAIDGGMRGTDVRLLALQPAALLRIPVKDPMMPNTELNAMANLTDLAAAPAPGCTVRESVGIVEKWVDKPVASLNDDDVTTVTCSVRHTGSVILTRPLPSPSPSPAVEFKTFATDQGTVRVSVEDGPTRPEVALLEVDEEDAPAAPQR